jgi:hypothetical protein
MTPDRIEAAARAMARAEFPEYDDDEFEVFWSASEGAYTRQERKAARAAIAAAYPELAAGTHWLAPMEATEGMIEAGGRVVAQFDRRFDMGDGTAEDAWAAMRDAYLNTNPKAKATEMDDANKP